jgi:Domain of unknown function (DUF6484)
MGNENSVETEQPAQEESLDSDLLRSVFPTVAVGELIAITNSGRTPLVVYPGQPGSAGVPARSIVDLRGAHVGKRVALLFEGADITRPIVAGVLRDCEGWPLTDEPGQVEVDADGDRLIVSAKSQLVLRCGRASVTLTKEGKILIQGTYVSSRSSGVHRIKGGSVQIN